VSKNFAFFSGFEISIEVACIITGLRKSSLYAETKIFFGDSAAHARRNPALLYLFMASKFRPGILAPNDTDLRAFCDFIWHANNGSCDLPNDFKSGSEPLLILASLDDLKAIFNRKPSAVRTWIRAGNFPMPLLSKSRPCQWALEDVLRAKLARINSTRAFTTEEINAEQFRFLSRKLSLLKAKHTHKRMTTGDKVMQGILNAFGRKAL